MQPSSAGWACFRASPRLRGTVLGPGSATEGAGEAAQAWRRVLGPQSAAREGPREAVPEGCVFPQATRCSLQAVCRPRSSRRLSL